MIHTLNVPLKIKGQLNSGVGRIVGKPIIGNLRFSQIQNEFMRSSFLPKCQPKILRLSALEVYQRVAQKSLKILVGILGEMMTSKIYSEFNRPLITYFLLDFAI